MRAKMEALESYGNQDAFCIMERYHISEMEQIHLKSNNFYVIIRQKTDFKMLKLNLIKCQDLQSPQLNDNSESKRVANSNCSDIKNMQLKFIDEFSQSVRANKQRPNNRYSIFENSDDDEEEKSEIVRDEAIRHFNNNLFNWFVVNAARIC